MSQQGGNRSAPGLPHGYGQQGGAPLIQGASQQQGYGQPVPQSYAQPMPQGAYPQQPYGQPMPQGYGQPMPQGAYPQPQYGQPYGVAAQQAAPFQGQATHPQAQAGYGAPQAVQPIPGAMPGAAAAARKRSNVGCIVAVLGGLLIVGLVVGFGINHYTTEAETNFQISMLSMSQDVPDILGFKVPGGGKRTGKKGDVEYTYAVANEEYAEAFIRALRRGLAQEHWQMERNAKFTDALVFDCTRNGRKVGAMISKDKDTGKLILSLIEAS